MSGFEVVGVVLGAAPLIISALESYQKLGKKFDAFRKKSIHIGRMIRALSSQQRLIQSDVEIVLRNAEETDLSSLQSHGGSLETLLLRKDVQEEVRAFLGSNYDEYIAVLAECERILLSIAKSITTYTKASLISNDSLADFIHAKHHMLEGQDDFWKRVRFTMGRENLEQAIRELDETSTRLSRLSQQSHQVRQIELVAPSTKAKSAVTLLRKVQARATALHSAFARSWQSQCHNEHKVRLHLDPRLTIGSSKASGKVSSDKDAINIFCVTFVGKDGQQPSFQHTCNVQPLKDEDDDNGTNSLQKRKVAFQTASAPLVKQPKWKVQNICSTVAQCKTTSDAVCLYLSDDAFLHYGTLPAGSSKTTVQQSTISLRQLMRSSAIRFSLKQRMKMAAVLSSSIMQLYATPWWSAGLQKDSIFLPYDGSSNVDFHSPFVSCHFTGKQNALQPNFSDSNSLKGELELLQLGILIIELWQNETIEEFASKFKLQLENTYDSRQSVARKWLALLEEDLVTSVYNSALRCINCRFDAAVIDLESNVKLNQSIFELVVKPLWENCEH